MSALPVYCISISHKHAPLETRKLFAFSAVEAGAFLQTFCAQGGQAEPPVAGAVLLSTCNRIELYVSTQQGGQFSVNQSISGAQEALAQAKGQPVSLLRKHCLSFAGADAVRHLFSVASGLDSMVLGENQILGQMREAYKAASDARHTDFFLHMIFQRALSCAKRIKTETNLSKTTESIATLAVKDIMQTEDGGIKKVLLIGATGQTGGTILKDLSERKNVHVYATVRPHRALPPLPHVQPVAYEERYRYLSEADVVVSATKSPHCTITRDEALPALTGGKPRLFLDLAVPCDIDPSIAGTAQVTLKNIDSFTALAKEHNRQKQQGAVQAEAILQSELDGTLKELLFHEALAFVEDFGAGLQGRTGKQFMYDMRRAASASELTMLLGLWQRMAKERAEA